MKKVIALTFLTLFLFASMAMVSAVSIGTTIMGQTIQIEGDLITPVDNATVEINCTHGSETSSVTMQSNEIGVYSALFNTADCDINDTVFISAVKGDLSGSTNITINTYIYQDARIPMALEGGLGVGIVPMMIPEFGVFVGALTLMSAVGLFFLIRRK